MQQYLFNKNGFYGGIGFVDAETIMLNNGFQPVVFPFQNSFSPLAKAMRILYLITKILFIPKGSIIAFVHPSYAKMHSLLLRLIKTRKSIKTICVIGDIDGIRDEKPDLLSKECSLFRSYDIIIAHNRFMAAWLSSYAKVDQSKIVELTLFDFKTIPVNKNRKLSPVIVFAGNVITNPFVDKLHLVTKVDSTCKYNIYGSQKNIAVHENDKLHYYAYEQDPYKVPELLNGSFGLIWYGDSLEECSGAIGEYIRYISQHKLSFYIISSLPIIVWEEAAAASFVKEHNIGITIKSIYDIEDKIRSITEAEYETMCNNMKPLAQKISSGYFLTTAINKAISILDGE